MRKYYIDNLRWIFVLLLFPYHTFMVYNSFGEGFYVKGVDIPQTTGFIAATWPWFMPLLFVIAGISSAFALQNRSPAQYVKERISKLLIPLIAGILILIPVQTFFAEKFHNGYTGGYFQQYILFFTKPTDLTGYTGGFTPGQLWFILYLFVISIIALPIMSTYHKSAKKFPVHNIPMLILLTLFILPLLGALILDIGGKSLGEYFAYSILGYFVLSDENILENLDKYRFALFTVSVFSMVLILLCWCGILSVIPDIIYDIFSRFYAWTSILAIIGLGRHYLNYRNKITDYFSKSSFSVYIFHQTWIVMAAYYTLMITKNIFIQIIIILITSILATFISYELCKRMRITRFLFGIKM